MATIAGVGSRRRRLRNEIRENLALVKAIEEDEILREHTPTSGWLQGKITVDVARLAGRALGTPKKPIPWGSLVFAAILAAYFPHGHYISSAMACVVLVFPGLVAFLMAMSIMGMTTNRQLPPEQTNDWPPGATPIKTGSAMERVATSVELAAAGGLDARFSPTGQVAVVFRFFTAMHEGRYEEGLSDADGSWILCRLQAWLWNNRTHFGADLDVLESLAESLFRQRLPGETWSAFVASEIGMFVEAWGPLDPNAYGAASRRRRLSKRL